MFNKLKQLLNGNTEEPIPSDDLPPAFVSHIDFTIPRTAYYEKQIPDDASCPTCQTPLEGTYAPFMVALTDKRGNTIDGFILSDDNIGRFCPNCPTIVLSRNAVDEQLDALEETIDDLPDDYGIAILGLLDLEKMAELEEQEEEIEEYPIIPFLAPKSISKNRPSGRKKTKPRKKRKKRR